MESDEDFKLSKRGRVSFGVAHLAYMKTHSKVVCEIISRVFPSGRYSYHFKKAKLTAVLFLLREPSFTHEDYVRLCHLEVVEWLRHNIAEFVN